MGPGFLRVGGGGGIAGNVYINGNVGINTANPTSRLSVAGAITATGRVGIGTTTPGYSLDVSGGAAHIQTTDPQLTIRTNRPVYNASKAAIQFFTLEGTNPMGKIECLDRSTGNGIFQNDMIFYSGLNVTNVERMRILANGNVGIATSTPAYALDVAGSIRAYNIPVAYSCVNADSAVVWIRVGVFTVSALTGQMCIINLYGETGYNANADQSNTTKIFFKASNGSPISGINATGFAGDCYYYTEGRSTSLPQEPIWISNQAGINARTFTLFIRVNAYNTNAFYTVQIDQTGPGTWTDSYSYNTTPSSTTSSSTCLVATNQYSILSPNIYFSGGVISPITYLFVGSALRSRNSAGTLTTPTVGNYSYMSCDTTNNTNWTPSYSGGNNSRLLVPVAGVYSITYCLQLPTTENASFFISKNEGGGNDLNVGGLLSTTTISGGATCLSTTVYLITTDFICCGFYLGSGTGFTNSTMNTRSRLTLTLLQRTA
jgi:hypothetical protein